MEWIQKSAVFFPNYFWPLILKCPPLFSSQFFHLPPVKMIYPINSPPTCSSSYSLYKCIWLVIVFVISLFVPPWMAPAGPKVFRKKYSALYNYVQDLGRQSSEGISVLIWNNIPKSKINNHKSSCSWFLEQLYIKTISICSTYIPPHDLINVNDHQIWE